MLGVLESVRAAFSICALKTPTRQSLSTASFETIGLKASSTGGSFSKKNENLNKRQMSEERRRKAIKSNQIITKINQITSNQRPSSLTLLISLFFQNCEKCMEFSCLFSCSIYTRPVSPPRQLLAASPCSPRRRPIFLLFYF